MKLHFVGNQSSFLKLICIFLPFSNIFNCFSHNFSSYPCSRTQINVYVGSISLENGFIYSFQRTCSSKPTYDSELHVSDVLVELTCNLHLMNQIQSYLVISFTLLQHYIYSYICSFLKTPMWILKFFADTWFYRRNVFKILLTQ